MRSPAITANFLYDGQRITFGCKNHVSNPPGEDDGLVRVSLDSITVIEGEEEIKANINGDLVIEHVKNQVNVCNSLKSQLEEELNKYQETLIAIMNQNIEILAKQSYGYGAVVEQLKPFLVEIYNLRIQIALLGNDFFSDTHTLLYSGNARDLVKGIDICLGRDAVIEQHDSSYKGLVYYVSMIELSNDNDHPFYELESSQLAKAQAEAKEFMNPRVATKAARDVLSLDTDDGDQQFKGLFAVGGGRINRKKKRKYRTKRINKTKRNRRSKGINRTKRINRIKRKRGSKRVKKKSNKKKSNKKKSNKKFY